MANPFVTFFNWAVATWKAADTLTRINMVLTAATLAVGVKGFMQQRAMMAKGQDIMANKVAAGGKLPVIYGNRRVGCQLLYMDNAGNNSTHLNVVYALSVGEVEEIMLETLEIDGNPLTDPNQFRNGGYLGSDKISSGAGSLCTANQTNGSVDLAAGTFGTNPALGGYRYVFNAHHGAASQTADPMLVATTGGKWTSAHKLNGVAYIAGSFIYDAKGQFKGVPQITVQVKGRKIFDPRDNSTAWSDNPALCFLDYIQADEYGKGLATSQINMSTFITAANKADTLVEQPYFNGTAKAVTWSGVAGDDFLTLASDDAWWQGKIGELLSIYDANGNQILDREEIQSARRDRFFGTNVTYYKWFIGSTLSSTFSSEAGSYKVETKRFHCNGYLDGNKTVMENAKELLGNMRGLFLYVNGKYELQIEDTGSSTFSINDNHIISDSGISVDYGNKDKKANKVIIEYFNAGKKYELDTATVLHTPSVSGESYTYDDSGEVLEIKAEFPYITDPYIAYNMGKAILTRSRNQTTMQFLGTPEMYKLNVGDIVDLSYSGIGFNGKICRVEALELQQNGLVAVSLIEYFDVYTWEVPPQEPLEELQNIPSAYAVKAPTSLAFTDTDDSNTGRPFLAWDLPTDFPTYQFRVNVKDSAGNQQINKIVDVNNCDLNFLPVDTNYVASVTSLNTMGVESNPATLTFTVGDAPTDTPDIKDDAITLPKIGADVLAAINAGGVGSTQLIKSTTSPTTRSDGSALQSQDLWADTNDNNQIYVRNASNNGWEKARDSSLVTLYNSLSSTVSTNTSNISTAQGDIVTLTTDTSANATSITNLTASVNTNTAGISTEQTARANADTALASDITSLTSTVSGNTSAISSEATTRANADTALASDITSLTSTVGTNTAAISTEATTRANADTALSTSITNLTSTVGTNTASVSTNASAITDINDNASAAYVLQLNANGKVAKMVLESNADAGTGATSTISFLADTFKIDNDAGTSVSPFVVSGGTVLIDNARITNLSGTKIDVDTLAVKYFANVSSKIYDHQSTPVAVPLLKYGSAIRGAGGNVVYSGSNASFVPFTITQVRNNASYTATFSAVLGDVNGGRVQYSLDNSNWVNASGGETNIYWSAGTFRGYTYTYQGDITNMTASQTSVYWRVYFSGAYNHTHMQLHVTMDNTT
tara:strand:+ start:5469 stop:8987 length:3519 start_codon:yes stop_codon:yes gene_type:complete